MRRVIPWCALLVGFLALSCKGSSDERAEVVLREPVAAAKPAPGGDGGTAAVTDQTAYTPEQQARYRRHLHLGREYGRKHLYGEAVHEFEQALEVMPMDSRALSELGWVAFQSGDYERARAANEDAVRVTADPEVRAASLYNLGRIAEATDDRAEAERLFRESLELRPNKVVSARLIGMAQGAGRPQSVAPANPACGPFVKPDDLCRCAIEKSGAAAGASCHREARGVPDIELLFAGDDKAESVYLTHLGAGGWSTVALLGRVYDEAERDLHQEFELARMETRTVGARKVLWIETVSTRTDAAGVQASRSQSLFLCPWSEDGADIACVLGGAVLDEASAKDKASGRALEVDVREDGTVRVILAHGAKTDDVAPLLGTHHLW